MRYLLDTNILSDIVRNQDGVAAGRFASAPKGTLATSIIAAAEMRFGYVRISSKRLERKVETMLSQIDILDWTRPADFAYANIRTAVEKMGVTVGQNDMLIAAHATVLDRTLVSDDRIFGRLPGLKVENWLRAEPAAH